MNTDGRRGTLLVVAGSWFLLLGLRFVVPAVLPQVKAAFAVDNAAAGFAVTLIWACYAVMQFPAGMLADRLGERRLLSAGVGLTGVSLVAFFVAPTFPLFLVACVAMGLGSGLFGPARGMVLSRAFPDRSGAALGLTLAAGSVGSAALPFASAALVARGVDWATTLAVYTPLTVVAAVLLWVVVPRDDEGGRPDDDEAEGTNVSVREVAAGLRRALSTRAVAFPIAGMTLMLFSLQGLTAFLPTYLAEAKGLSQSTAAGLYAGLFLAGAVWQVSLGSLADRRGERLVLLVVVAVGVVTLLALPVLTGLVALAALVLVLGMRLAAGPVTNAHVLRELPDDVRGTAWGLARTGFFLLGATGSVVVGAFADADLFAEAFVFLAAVTAVAGLFYARMPSRSDE